MKKERIFHGKTYHFHMAYKFRSDAVKVANNIAHRYRTRIIEFQLFKGKGYALYVRLREGQPE
jgi:hypothetical protein